MILIQEKILICEAFIKARFYIHVVIRMIQFIYIHNLSYV